MKTEDGFEYFTHYILPPFVLVLGIFGNILGLSILLRKRLAGLPSRNMFCFLLLFDSIYLTNFLINYLEVSFGIVITTTSSITCKIQSYFSYSLATISPMILVFITFERYFEIIYPITLIRNKRIQLIYLITILIFNLIFYLPFPILVDKISIKDDLDHYVMCSFFNSAVITIVLSYMDLTNRIIIPFGSLIICSILLIVSIMKSGNQHLNSKDLTKTSIVLNLFNILLALPVLLNSFLNISEFSFTFTLYLFYSSYAINFYIILLTNSLIRNEILVLLKVKPPIEESFQRYLQINNSFARNECTEVMEISTI